MCPNRFKQKRTKKQTKQNPRIMNTLHEVSYLNGVGDQFHALLSAQACARRQCSGASIGIVKGSEFTTYSAGFHSSCGVGVGVKVSPPSLFDSASITKAIPIALLVLWAVTEKHIALETKISVFFPRLRVEHGECPTIKDLLTYACRFDLDFIESPYTGYGDADVLLDKILSANVTTLHTRSYGNYPPIFLGVILEKITGGTIQQLSREVIFDPLGITSATFSPPDDPSLVVQTEIMDRHTKEPRRSGVHDELTVAIGGRPGSAGLFVNTSDLLRVQRFLLNMGSIGTRQIIAPELIREIGKNQFKQDDGFGLGFGLWSVFSKGYDDDGVELRGLDPRMLQDAYFKLGFTGCGVFIFPRCDLGVVINTNYIHPAWRGSSLWINWFRWVVVMTALTGAVPSSAKILWNGADLNMSKV